MSISEQDPASAGSDEALVAIVAAGDELAAQRALAALHRRWAGGVFRLAARSLDEGAAADVVQEVFLGVWRNAARFDASRGSFRGWLRRAAVNRIANEMRRRRRRPLDGDAMELDALPASGGDPHDAASLTHRRAVLRAAFAELPAAQRQALALAFFDDLTHVEVADALAVPLGTAKTRIRDGLLRLRRVLGPVAATLMALLMVVVGTRWVATRSELARDDRALGLLTASDAVNLRLGPVPGVPADTHARYHGRAGTGLAVVTLSHFPPAARGTTFVVWVRHADRWTALGSVLPDPEGNARLIAEDPRLAVVPDAVVVTQETAPGMVPGPTTVVIWPPP